MITRQFQDVSMPVLGLGLMRLPTLENGEIDEPQVAEMVRTALDGGLKYFDTAYPYHGGKSELAIGKILEQYPRDSFYLADKYPGHQHLTGVSPKEIFEEQLEKCRVSYFDFYLLHNVNEGNFNVYTSDEVIPYFLEEKKKGRIRHLGFSCHAKADGLETFLQYLKDHGDPMEFCQIQLNYLDWTLQEAKRKVELLKAAGLPVWVMEPLRGGKLIDDIPGAFRFLLSIPEVTVILSGMSNLQQLKENLQLFQDAGPLTDQEWNALLEKAEAMKNGVPCTGCRYCVEGCPMGLSIPTLLSTYNEMKTGAGLSPIMYLEGLPEEKRPHACIACGACAQACPQNIEIPDVMAELADIYDHSKKWSEICKEREEAAKALKEAKK